MKSKARRRDNVVYIIVGVVTVAMILVLLNPFGSTTSSKKAPIDEELHRKLEANLVGRRHEMHSRGRLIPQSDLPTKLPRGKSKNLPAQSREEMYERSFTPEKKTSEEEAPDYSFDVSWPMHSKFPEDSDYGSCKTAYEEGECEKQKTKAACPASCGNVFERRYGHFIQGCYDHYDRKSCRSVDDARLSMNKRQPREQNHFTDVGFGKTRVPEELWAAIQDYWKKSPKDEKNEQWTKGNIYTNHWEVPTYMVNLEDHSEDPKGLMTGWQLKKKIWDETKPIIERWTGKELKPTSLYGIRVYHEGAILASHCDRLPLVSSAIVNVDQDVDEPWPLEIYDHFGKAHNVTMEPGDMVLYESHVCVHGRPFPLKGRYFANLFVHFEPVDGSNNMKKQLRGKL